MARLLLTQAFLTVDSKSKVSFPKVAFPFEAQILAYDWLEGLARKLTSFQLTSPTIEMQLGISTMRHLAIERDES